MGYLFLVSVSICKEKLLFVLKYLLKYLYMSIFCSTFAGEMKAKANCKINIGLRVVNKREDGYHNLDTLFFPVYGLYDEVEIVESDLVESRKTAALKVESTLEESERAEAVFVSNGILLDCEAENNLVLKCYYRMAAKYPQIRSVRITLDKRIPFGAGLGGGSSDAAHTALILNELFNLGLTKEQLAEEVKPLGADCPFFIYNTPCHAEGIGDILTPVDFSLKGKRLVMIKPDVSVSTKEAYSGLVPSGKTLGDVHHWRQFENDFEKTVFAKYPEIAAIKKRLLEAGAEYAAMSGSGSTVFGLFENDAEGRTVANLRLFEEEFASMIIFNDTL